MSWLTEFVRPKIRTLLGRREVPENLWHQCPACQQMIFHTRARDEPQGVPALRPPHARDRRPSACAWTFDEGSFTRIELPKVPARSAALPRQPSAIPTGCGTARERRTTTTRCSSRTARIGGQQRGRRGDGVRVHGRLDGRRGRRGHRRRGQARGAAGGAADRVHRLRRRAHAGRRDQPDADAAHRSSPRGW